MLKSRIALGIRQFLFNLILDLFKNGINQSCLNYHSTDWQPK